MPDDEILDETIDTTDTTIENIPTSDEDIIAVNDILLELDQMNETLDFISTVKPLAELLLNRLELLLFTNLILLAVLIFIALRRTPK